MSDDRTADQRAADDHLVAAVERAARAHGSLSPSSVLTRCIVIGSGVGMTDDGDDTTVRVILLPMGSGAVDWDALLGMLRGTTLRLEADYLSSGEDEDE